MPVSIICPQPQCRKPLVVADAHRNRAACCPHCRHVFHLPASATPPMALPAATLEESPVPDVPLALPLDDAPPAQATTCFQPAPPAADVRSQVGRFTVRQRLGEGAFGVVYQAHDPQLDRAIALLMASGAALAPRSRC